MDKLSIALPKILVVLNSVVVFQLFFFTTYLFIRGRKIPATFYLKIHLLFQLISYINYVYFSNDYPSLKYILLISYPCTLLWSPSFYLYIRARLYKNIIPSPKQAIHLIPAFILFLSLVIIILRGNMQQDLNTLGGIVYYCYKIQLLIYMGYTLYIIYNYRRAIKNISSANDNQKLNWLYFITYGFIINAFIGFILYIFSSIMWWDYFFFFIFINFFFFKAIIQPDQFLGIDEEKPQSIKLQEDKGTEYFKNIDELVEKNEIFLDPELSLHNVSQAVKLPDRLVSLAIKQNTGMNFADYINQKRINYAKHLLRSTTKSEKNVLEILYEAGFNSKSVFNSQFKKHTGQSPTKFRQSNCIV